MYIVELTGRYFKAQGAGCLVHNETMRMPYLFNTVGEAANYIKSMYNVPIYLDRIRTINGNNDDIYVYKFSDTMDDPSKEINVIPCSLYSKEL